MDASGRGFSKRADSPDDVQESRSHQTRSRRKVLTQAGGFGRGVRLEVSEDILELIPTSPPPAYVCCLNATSTFRSPESAIKAGDGRRVDAE